MAEQRHLNPPELAELLDQALKAKCSASLRVDGSARMLGQLRVCGVEPGLAVQLDGVKHRDLLPAAGTAVSLLLLLDDEVVTIHTWLLDPLVRGGGRPKPRVLRAAWPTLPLEFHHRDEVRVATPDLPPLGATLVYQGTQVAAKLLNLTETGIGLGLEDGLPFLIQGEVVVETLLPGGVPLQLVGEVRHSERLKGDPLPVRIGLVLKELAPEAREALRGMIQARRIIRSEAIREE